MTHEGGSSELAEVVGLIPAAGQAKRLQPLAVSKELLPIGSRYDTGTGQQAPKAVSEYLLDKFRAAGIRKTFLVIRNGKWDIPAHFLDGERVDMSLSYVVISGSSGPPETIDRAYPFVARNRVAFGFPDILFGPPDAFAQLIRKQEETGADVVLGLHRIAETHTWDMVQTEANGVVRRIDMKPAATELTFGWHFAVWTPVFTEFLHRFVHAALTERRLEQIRSAGKDAGGDLAVGTVLQAALTEGLKVQSVKFSEGAPLDIGSPENLRKGAAWDEQRHEPSSPPCLMHEFAEDLLPRPTATDGTSRRAPTDPSTSAAPAAASRDAARTREE
jgi:glucose-1-phosphate thymidylyltransferase